MQNMKAEAGDSPNHIFPLRDVESQYSVEFKIGPETRRLGSLSFGQLMREAYPGAIYYYATTPYRVFKIYNKVVKVRREKKYTSRPTCLPTCVYPNLSEGNIYNCKRMGDLILRGAR